MNKITMSLLTLSISWLSGCVMPPLVVGQPRAAIASEDVAVYYAERPRCDFETVAHLQVTGGYLTIGSMIEKMREQAAELGASGVYVLQTQQLDIREFLGSAKAIRCLQA